MRKKHLLEVIEKSIFKDDVSTRDLYETFYPVILEILQPFKDQAKINGLSSLDELSNKTAFDVFIRSNSPEIIGKKIEEIINELRKWVITHQNLACEIRNPNGTEQKQMRLKITSRLDKLINNCVLEHSLTVLQKLKTSRDIMANIWLPRKDVNIINVYQTIMSQIDKIDSGLKFSHSDEEVLSGLVDELMQDIQRWEQMQY